MKSQTRILVPVDFSKESMYGFKTALHIARFSGGELHLLHVIDEPEGTDFNLGGDMIANEKAYQENIHFIAELIKSKTKQLDKLRIKYDNPDVPMEIAVESGLYKEGLENYLDSHKIDMIVMGTTGETSISEIFTGNHANLALRIADVPVLAVKNDYSPLQLDKLLLGVELTEYDEKPVRLIRKFAALINMRVLIVHVIQDKDLVVDDIVEFLHNFAHRHKFSNYDVMVAEKGKVVKQLRKAAREKGADMIATITEGDSGLIRLIFGSKTEKMIEKSARPVLSIRE